METEEAYVRLRCSAALVTDKPSHADQPNWIEMMSAHNDDHGLWFLNNHVSVALSKNDNKDGISVLRLRVPFDEAPPFHVHHEEDEVFHLLRGEVLFQVGDQRLTARAGDTLLGPKGIPHGFRVISENGAEFLTITRGGFEDMVRSLARPATRPSLPEPTDVSPDMQAALAEASLAHAIELLGPPIR